MLEWMGFISTELHKGFGPLFKPDTPDAYKTIVSPTFIAGWNISIRRLRAGRIWSATASRSRTPMRSPSCAGAIFKIDVAYPNISSYMERVSNREKVRQALGDEGCCRQPEASAS